jgi:hypothetical protein
VNWQQYKARCDSPEVYSRWMLQQTLELLSDERVADRLLAALSGVPLQKPDDHRGGATADMFVLSLTLAEARTVLAEVAAAVARGATTTATRNRGLGGFVEAWGEYVRYLERQPPSAGLDCSAKS